MVVSKDIYLKIFKIYIRIKSDYLRLDQVSGIFYYSIPEHVKKYCFQMEIILSRYLGSDKNIETVRYLAFEKLKLLILTAGFDSLCKKWSSYPIFEIDQPMACLLMKNLVTGKELFCFMFFLITVMDKFSMIAPSNQSLKIRNDIFTLVGLLQLNLHCEDQFGYLNCLGKYLKKRITEKYYKDISFGRGLIIILELEYLVSISTQISTDNMREYCIDSMNFLLFALKSHLEAHYLVRSHSALSHKKPTSSKRFEPVSLDDLAQQATEREAMDFSINGIIFTLTKMIELCALLTAFQTLMPRIKHHILNQKLKEVIQTIVSISLARKNPLVDADEQQFNSNATRKHRLEPIRVKKRSGYPILQADDTNGIPLTHKSSIVLPPLQKIGN